jgi:hypothetical protein
MSVTLDWTNALLMRSGKEFKLSSDGGDSGKNKSKQGYGGAYSGVLQSI